MTAEPDPHDPEGVLTSATAMIHDALGSRLLAAFAIGSLAHGGFAPAVSDVDLAVILADPPLPGDRDTLDRVAAAVRARGGLAARLSLFWATAAQAGSGDITPGSGRLPALDRLDLARHGRRLHGSFDLGSIELPSQHLLVVEAVQLVLRRFANAEANAELWDPEALARRGPRVVTKRVLFPVRFMFTAATGSIGENDAAATWYLARGGPSGPLIAAARRWRTEPFDEPAAVALLRAHVVPLYDEFVAQHVPILRDLGEPRLAASLEAWSRDLHTRPPAGSAC